MRVRIIICCSPAYGFFLTGDAELFGRVDSQLCEGGSDLSDDVVVEGGVLTGLELDHLERASRHRVVVQTSVCGMGRSEGE